MTRLGLPALALGLFQVTCTRHPAPDIEFLQAAAREQSGDHCAALEAYRGFLARAPAHRLAPLAAMAAADILAQSLADTSAAVEAYRSLAVGYPESPWAAEAARRRGECLAARADWAGAAEAYGQALELFRSDGPAPPAGWIEEVSVAAADCHFQLGDRGRVIATYERALEAGLPPGAAAPVLLRLGDCYEAGGRPPDAARAYARILGDFPLLPAFDRAMARRELIEQHLVVDWIPLQAFVEARQALRGGDAAGALTRIDGLSATPGPPALGEAAEYYRILAENLLSGDFGRAARDLRQLLARVPDPRCYPAGERLQTHFDRTARLEAAVRAEPGDAAALCELGNLYLASRMPERALAALQQALALDPQDPQTNYHLGLTYNAIGDAAAAQAALAVCLAHDPYNSAALGVAGYCHLGSGEVDQAIDCFRRQIEAFPDDANAHDSLGEALLAAGRLEEAEAEWRRALAYDDRFAHAHFMLGRLYREMGRAGEAIEAFQRFVALQPRGPQAEEARQALSDLGAG